MKTVRVRIAVAVNQDGGWTAVGYFAAGKTPPSDDELRATARDVMDCRCRVSFIEAEVPATVEGEVVQ